MKSIFLGILVLVLSLLTCFGQKNKFEIFGTKIKPKEITGGHEFNDLGVKQTTDVISSLTDDTLTYLWRLGTLRLKVHDYTAGFQSLFDLSYSNSNEGYPILDEIDFAYYVNWGFTISEQEAEEIYRNLDHNKIESAALNAEDIDEDIDDQMDSQLNAALDEIINQVKTMDSELIRKLFTQKRFDL